MMDADDALKKEIREILDVHQPFRSWKAVSRALWEIIDLVGWFPPDEKVRVEEEGR